MATAINAPYSTEIKLGPHPQNFALKFVAGKNLGDSKFPPFLPRVLFTAIDDRKLFLEAEDASDFEHALLELQVKPGDFVTVARVKLPRGGHSIRVARVENQAAPTREETLLAKSVQMARKSGPAAFIDSVCAAIDATPDYGIPNPPAPSPIKVTPASAQMCAAMCAAIDAVVETQAYAERRGVPMTFSEESVRAIGLSIYIGNQRAAR